MSPDPAFGPKTLAHKFRAAGDDIVAVIDARLACQTSAEAQGAGIRAYSTAERTAAFAAARLHKSPLASQNVCANSRAVRAAVAMEQVPLP